jgi:hypothetical protein
LHGPDHRCVQLEKENGPDGLTSNNTTQSHESLSSQHLVPTSVLRAGSINKQAGIITKHKTLSFRSSDFQEIALNGENFLAALKNQAGRVLSTLGSPWRTRKSAALPFTEPNVFLHHFGRLHALEVPASLVKSIRSTEFVATDSDVWEYLHQLSSAQDGNVTHVEEVNNWLRGLAGPAPQETWKMEVGEFKKFYLAISRVAREEPFRFSEFTYSSMNCWRIFVQLYPSSIRLLERFCARPDYFSEKERMAAFGLISTLASSHDGILSDKANELMMGLSSRFVSSRAKDFAAYKILRQLHFNVAEASGKDVDIKNCIDFIHAHPLDWDLNLYRPYYRDTSDAASIRSSSNKLKFPKQRDLRTRRISEFFINRLSSYLPAQN